MLAKGSNRPSATVKTYYFDVEKADELTSSKAFLFNKLFGIPKHNAFTVDEF